jgi:hypothetical protein
MDWIFFCVCKCSLGTILAHMGSVNLTLARLPYSFRRIPRCLLGAWITGNQHHSAFDKPVELHWWTCLSALSDPGDWILCHTRLVIKWSGTTGTRTQDPLILGRISSTTDLHRIWSSPLSHSENSRWFMWQGYDLSELMQLAFMQPASLSNFPSQSLSYFNVVLSWLH